MKNEFKVKVPEENYQILTFSHNDLPGIAVVNTSLKNFEPKQVFSWHCSIIVEFEDLIQNGMPSSKDVKILEDFEDFLDKKIKGNDINKPNALFLARVTYDSTRELIWRVFDPEICNAFLEKVISKKNIREFQYRIENDENWEFTEWFLNQN